MQTDIKNFMTPCPYTVNADTSLDKALEMMKLRSIRHLPVVSDGNLIGVVAERDILVSQMVCQTTKFCPSVGDICFKEPLIFTESTTLSDVALKLAESREDCAIISDDAGNFVGIFTTTDACKALHLVCGK